MRSKGRQKGNALLEMALGSTMLFGMLAGVIDFGRAFYFTDIATGAARAGAQYGIQAAANFGNHDMMEAAAARDANGVSGFTAEASSYCTNAAGSTVTCDGSSGLRGWVKVTTSIPYRLLVPWPWLPGNVTVKGHALMRTQ
jgi:Flp pilus assembly protein TadG